MDSGAWRGFPFDWYPPAPVLVFPFPPMLAALKHSLPIGDQWLYEPKLVLCQATLDLDSSNRMRLL